MGEADEQLPSLRGGDRPTELVVGQDTDKAAEQSAAFAFSDSEGEQLSLSLYGDAERRWDAPHRKSRAKPQTAAPAEDVFQKNTSDVFDWNTPDVTGDVIDRLLTAGGNEMHSRERIAAFFLQDRFEPEDAADFLRREYGTGGKGVRVDGVDYSLWFDKDGLRIARGHDTRTARAVTLSYADVAERIDRLLQDGHYASAAQLADARPNEYREIASDIWYVYHDRDKSADSRGFFTRTAALIKGGYPDAVARIAEGLSDPVQRAALTAELSAFTAAAQTDSSLYRFRYIRTRAAQTVKRLQRTERMNKGYTAENGFEPSRPSFITQDEIDHMLCGGSHVDGSKHRIYSFLTDSHTKKERIDFIKDKYGTGGYSHAGYDEWHDSTGISLKRADEMAVYDTIKLSWSQVEQHLGALIRQGRYMTADEIEQYERSRTDTVRLTEESPTGDVFRANTQKGEEQTSNQLPKDERFQPNIQDLYNKYKPMVAAAVSTDESYCNACRNADRENAYLEGGAAIKRAVDSMGDMQLTKLYYDMTVFHNRLHKEVLDETYSILAMHVENSENVQMRESEGEYCYRYTNKNSPMSDWGHAMFVDDEESSEEYGRENPVRFKVNRERLVDIVDFRDEIIHKLEEQYENGTLPAGIDSIIEFGCTIEEIVRDFNPTDIVMNAAAWDNDDLTMWFYENIAEPHGVYGFKTEDGAIVFDENLIESEENPMQWMKPVADDIQVDTSKEQISSASDSEEAAQSAAADPARDVFHGNTLEEAAQSAAADPARDVFQKNTSDASAGAVPIIRCEWSESAVFEDGREYSVAEFDRLMKQADDEYVAGKNAAMQKYGTWQQWYDADDPYFARFLGYDKTKFTLILPDGRTFTERQDIGDGDGGVLDFLSQYDQYRDIVPLLRRVVDAERDVFHGNTLEEAAQSAATDLAHDVFHGNTLEEAVQSDAEQPEQDSEIKTTRQIINEYCMEEFGEEADFSNLERVPLAYSSTEDGEHDIQIETDLVSFRIVYTVDKEIVHTVSCKNLHELNTYLGNLSFSEMIADAEASYRELHSQTAEDVLHENILEEAAQSAATDLAHDVFHGNTLEEAVQSAAADPAHDVFHGNTLEEAAQSAGNFSITDGQLGVSTPKVRYTNNVAAIALLKHLEAENRPATSEEQMVLARYTGWGAIPQAFDAANTSWSAEYAALKELLTDEEYRAARASTLNAHYTSPTVIRAIYEAVGRMGFHGGTILEPSMGVGNFFGLLPEQMRDSRLYGVELDSITGRIAQKLYPNANITVDGFENTRLADDTFDLAVGNIPFGDYKVQDKQYDKHNLLIHDYFIAKTLDKVHPGGIVAMLTSKGTLDKADPKARRLLAEKADLLGAIRLPNNAFKANAGTRVTADILFLQKRDTPPEQMPAWVEIGQTADGLS
ncbi:MAG: LPD25 domain-containing protein, partial [Butyricicoccus porcorum]